jgi:hypothetical protein
MTVFKILLKDCCHTAISNAARKVATLIGVAMGRSVFVILNVKLTEKSAKEEIHNKLFK